VYYKAKDQALNNGLPFHLAAILWRGRRPIKICVNTDKTHPSAYRIYENGDEASHMHAEMNAIRFAKPGDMLEVMRFKKDGSIAMAKPCEHCQKLINNKEIFKKIRFTNHIGEWEIL